ncbi:hypothetical protein HUJ04_011413 [Dendroctonus ponderosae]|nr:hypothetical protein HUJ04_011413 [Dendroctonus ponderosae]
MIKKILIRHYENAIEARTEYKNDVSTKAGSESLFVSADLQKVIMISRCEMFTEIICFNESFVALGKQSLANKPVALVWHEGVAGRSKSDLISTFYKFLLFHRDVKEITIWLYNCASQNKNWALYCFFVFIISSLQLPLSYFNDFDDSKLVASLWNDETCYVDHQVNSFYCTLIRDMSQKHQCQSNLQKKRVVFDIPDITNRSL